MFIKWLKLHNIRSYNSAEIQFPEGTTLLSGDIGSGKSSILLSIEFALFGLMKGELSATSLLRKGEKSGYVELCFNIDGKDIILKRNLKKTNSSIQQQTGHIIINNLKKEATPIEMKSKILELMGYPSEMINKKNLIFRYTVYTPQEEMKRIIFEDREERLNTLRKAFGIDKYKRIRENSSILIKYLKEECRRIEGFISDIPSRSGILEQLKKDTNLIQSEIEPLKLNIKESNKHLSGLKNTFQSKKTAMEEFQKLHNSLSVKDSQLKDIVQRKEENNLLVEKIGKELEGLKLETIDISQKDELEKKIPDIESTIIRQKELYASILERNKQAKNNIQDIKFFLSENKKKISGIAGIEKSIKEIESIISDKPVCNERIEKKSKELIIIEGNLLGINQRIKSSRDVVNKLSSMDDCPLCFQKINISHKREIIAKESSLVEESKGQLKKTGMLRQSLIEEMESLKANYRNIEKYEKEKNSLKINLASLKHLQEDIFRKEQELQTEQQKLQKIETEKKHVEDSGISQMECNLKELKDQEKRINEYLVMCRIIEEKKKNLELLKQINSELKLRVIELNKSKLELNEKMSSYKDLKDDIKQLEDDIDAGNTKLKSFELKLTEKNTRLSSILEEMERINKELAKKIAEKKNLSKKKQYKDWIENSFISIISIIEKSILANLYMEFNLLFQEWFNILIEDEFITAKLDDEFTPAIQQNGYDTELENLSGGEKTALSLAYRLSLNKVISDITSEINTKDLIILDEPTDGFSDQQLDKIRDVLEKLNMKQVIIVSHENKIESFVDHIINIRKDQHSSVISL